MFRCGIIIFWALALSGQVALCAQEMILPDSLKLKQQTSDTAEAEFTPKIYPIFPENLFWDDSYRSRVPLYIDAWAWDMQLKEPVLPWGLQGSSAYGNYIGLGASRMAAISKEMNFGNLIINADAGVQKHFYDYQVATAFSVGLSATYSFSEQWSATLFGTYSTTPNVIFSPAVQAMMPRSGYGGYATYDFGTVSISGGVRQEFNPYTHSWETYPIVMPTVKIGDVKIGIDVGPVIKNGIQSINDKNRRLPPSGSPTNKR